MGKLKLEKVRQWFTPVHAMRYLFDDISDMTESEILDELFEITIIPKLKLCITNFHLLPDLTEVEESDSYLKLINYYNEHNHIYLPLSGFPSLKRSWLGAGLIKEDATAFPFDILNLTNQIRKSDELLDYPFTEELQIKNVDFVFIAKLTQFELGFNRDVLEEYLTRESKPRMKPSKIDDTRERDTMLKIIHGLAKNGYKYPAHGSLIDMVKDFQTNGNGVSEKTLKKYLDEFNTL